MNDALQRNIEEEQIVRVFNDRGEFFAYAHVTDKIRAGVVASPGIWWAKDHPLGRFGVNNTTSQALSDMGQCSSFQTNLVEIEKVNEEDLR